tara:strand:+ start:10990 stop:11211 length:222 start_codon:yes stop_codon:yes gene_type:complete
MQCLEFPSEITYIITFNNDEVNGTLYIDTNQEFCMPDSWSSEIFTNEAEYIERCSDLNIEPNLPEQPEIMEEE